MPLFNSCDTRWARLRFSVQTEAANPYVVLFASDEPWGDFTGEVARMRTAAGDGKLGQAMLRDNFAALYDPKS